MSNSDDNNESDIELSDGEINNLCTSQSETSIISGDEEMTSNPEDGSEDGTDDGYEVIEEDDVDDDEGDVADGEDDDEDDGEDDDEGDVADGDIGDDNVNGNPRGYGGFDDIIYPELPPRKTREVFLITLSQAPAEYSKEFFSTMIRDAFAMNGEGVIEKWVCAKEPHKNGGNHYHMTVKLDRQKRWQRVKTYISETYGVQVHFSDKKQGRDEAPGYDGAYMYTVKGGDFIVSQDHPRVDRGNQKNVKLQNAEFMKLVVQKELRTLLEVKAVAKRNADLQNDALYVFLANKGEKRVAEMLAMAWDIDEAPEKLARLRLDRISILREAEQSPCTCETLGQWEQLALEIMRLNNLPLDGYTQAVLAALTLGRGKFRNIMHIGETNRGKTFLVKPLKEIFSAFENPTHGNFNWLGVDLAEIIILNDLRWSTSILPWEQLLLLLEGETVKFQAPKNQYVQDVVLTHDTPIFATSRTDIEFKGGVLESKQENDMMATRWKTFKFKHQFTEDTQVECKPCKHCYASFLFLLNIDDGDAIVTLADFL